MTCIAGLEHNGKVWIGGDSAGASGGYLTIRADEKVWAAKGFAFGFTSSFRMGQLLRYNLTPALEHHEVTKTADAELQYMFSTKFIDGVRGVLKTGGFAQVSNGVERGGTFLVGWRGKLYMIHDDFQVGRASQGFYAVGSGGAHAEGALHATQTARMGAERRVLAALEAAMALVTTVQGPFKVVSA